MSAAGHEQTWWLKFAMSPFPASGHERRSDKVGSPSEVCGVRFRFLGMGLFQEKTKRNQSRIFVLVPRGGVRLFSVFNGLACPTFANRPIESQWIFLRLSHRFSAASHVRFSLISGHQPAQSACRLRANMRRGSRIQWPSRRPRSTTMPKATLSKSPLPI